MKIYEVHGLEGQDRIIGCTSCANHALSQVPSAYCETPDFDASCELNYEGICEDTADAEAEAEDRYFSRLPGGDMHAEVRGWNDYPSYADDDDDWGNE